MFYGIKNNIRVHINDVNRGELCFCPLCHGALSTKKGTKRRHHFAHKPSDKYSPQSGLGCDGWELNTKNYTSDWCVDWQNRFPDNCQEVVLTSENEAHISDVFYKNIAIEFQNTKISNKTFLTRNNFYTKVCGKVIWIFNLLPAIQNKSIYLNGEIYINHSKILDCLKNLDISNSQTDIYMQLNEDRVCKLVWISDDLSMFAISPFKPITMFISHLDNNEQEKGKNMLQLWEEANCNQLIATNSITLETVLIKESPLKQLKRNKRGIYGFSVEEETISSRNIIISKAFQPIWELKECTFNQTNNTTQLPNSLEESTINTNSKSNYFIDVKEIKSKILDYINKLSSLDPRYQALDEIYKQRVYFHYKSNLSTPQELIALLTNIINDETLIENNKFSYIEMDINNLESFIIEVEEFIQEEKHKNWEDKLKFLPEEEIENHYKKQMKLFPKQSFWLNGYPMRICLHCGKLKRANLCDPTKFYYDSQNFGRCKNCKNNNTPPKYTLEDF